MLFTARPNAARIVRYSVWRASLSPEPAISVAPPHISSKFDDGGGALDWPESKACRALTGLLPMVV